MEPGSPGKVYATLIITVRKVIYFLPRNLCDALGTTKALRGEKIITQPYLPHFSIQEQGEVL